MTAELEAAVRALRSGEVVAFPTETVYGLGADARNGVALQRVFDLKQRPHSHPLIVHLPRTADWQQWTRIQPEVAERLAAAFWPGPLTLVLPRAAGVLDLLTGGQQTIALRVPSHPVAQQLLAAFGGAIAAPSANRYGHVSPTRAAHVRDEFGDAVKVVIDGGDCAVGLESTIVDCSVAVPRLLRPGAIGLRALQAIVPDVVVGADAHSPRVSGSQLVHYAPRTPLLLVPGEQLEQQIAAFTRTGSAVAVLAMRAPGQAPGHAPGHAPADAMGHSQRVHWIDAGHEPLRYAHDLYANLRTLDKADCIRILVEQVPDLESWDAIRDRLRRAAAPLSAAEASETLAAGVRP